MRKLQVLAVLVTITLGLCASSVGAQSSTTSRSTTTQSIKLTIWPTSVTATTPSAANWSTMMWVIDYRLSYLPSFWGLQFQYGFGAQGGWGGASSGASSGNDTIWSADVTYTWETSNLLLTGFAGYGSLQWQTNLPAGSRQFTSAGFRVGVDALIPLSRTSADGSYWAIDASVAWYPSNATTLLSAGSTTTGTGSVRDWSIGLRYKFGGERIATVQKSDAGYSGYRLAMLQERFETSWGALAGYRILDVGSGWSGFFVSISKAF